MLRRRLCLAALSGLLFALPITAGCAAPRRGPAVPYELQDRAIIPGMSARMRTWGSDLNPEFYAAMIDSVHREQAALAKAGHTGPMPRAEFLALSGGGANGAFGAGLLCGWTEAGDRPRFKLITGISTGALIAPFAFAGPEYDGVLREVYTQITTRDLLKKRGFLAAVYNDAMADNRPMWNTLAKYVDEKLLAAIAAEHHAGRVLVIGTTNIDARRAVLWNIGEIAASGHPKALELVRSILIASASIPAAFPPVMFDVEVDGKPYQEMHVDGGAMTQVFLYPPSFNLSDATRAEAIQRDRRAWIIRNARLDPDWAQVDRRTLSIAGRAISALIHTQGIGDLYRIYLDAQRDGVDFNLAYIPHDFKAESKEPFDKEYMSLLFQRGFDMARNGYAWDKTPPGYVPGS